MSSNGTKEPTSGWAKPVDKLHVGEISEDAINLNVEGRPLAGLTHGFGQLWQKTYKVRLSGAKSSITPEHVVKEWKEHFSQFWPPGNRMYFPLTGIEPGEVGVLNLASFGGTKLSTGIMVIFSDETSFSFMNSKGHVFAAMITFSAYEEEGTTVAQVQMLIRASDPLYELGCRLGVVHKMEDEFWFGTLRNLSAYFGVNSSQPTLIKSLIDPRVQWKEWRNIWYNAGIRTGLYTPVAVIKKFVSKKKAQVGKLDK